MTPENKRHIKCQLEKKGKDWGIVFFEISFGSTSFRGSLSFLLPGGGERGIKKRYPGNEFAVGFGAVL